MSINKYYVDLDLWPEDKQGNPVYLHGPAASITGWIDIDHSTAWLIDYEPEEVAVMFAEDLARLEAGDAYESWWGIATVNQCRSESMAERLQRLGYMPLFYSYRMSYGNNPSLQSFVVM